GRRCGPWCWRATGSSHRKRCGRWCRVGRRRRRQPLGANPGRALRGHGPGSVPLRPDADSRLSRSRDAPRPAAPPDWVTASAPGAMAPLEDGNEHDVPWGDRLERALEEPDPLAHRRSDLRLIVPLVERVEEGGELVSAGADVRQLAGEREMLFPEDDEPAPAGLRDRRGDLFVA